MPLVMLLMMIFCSSGARDGPAKLDEMGIDLTRNRKDGDNE